MVRSLRLSLASFILLSAAGANAQCILNASCDDGDSCTVGDIVVQVVPGTAVCDSGSVEIPNPSSGVYSDSLALADQQFVSPFLYDYAAKMSRHQWLFLRSELDVELNQMNGFPDATGGLGTCEPITAIGFYVNDTITEERQKNLLFGIRLKHAQSGVNDLSIGFDNSVDPEGGCLSGVLPMQPELGLPGWRFFPLSEPFQWDGVRNVILEWAVNNGNENMLDRPLSVRYTAIAGDAPANQLTYAVTALPPYQGECAPIGAMVCGNSIMAAALSSTAPCYEMAGSSNLRPSVVFVGGVTTAPPATCLCAGAAADTDNDGLSDCEDDCPLGPNPGTPCDDGDLGTTNDVIGADCICVGEPISTGVGTATGAMPMFAWPNPCALDQLQLKGPSSGMLFDAAGRPVRSFTQARTIDLVGLPAGLYLLRLDGAGQERLIRE